MYQKEHAVRAHAELQHQAVQEKKENRELKKRGAVGRFFHPREAAKVKKALSYTGPEYIAELESKKKRLAELEKTKGTKTEDAAEYLKVLREVQEMEANIRTGQEFAETQTKAGKAVTKLEREIADERAELEKDAIAKLGDGASVAAINNYVREVQKRQDEYEMELFSEDATNIFGKRSIAEVSGHNDRKRKQILDETSRRQKIYENACREIYDGNLEDLLSLEPDELNKVLNKKADGAGDRTYSNEQKEMIRKYVEMTKKLNMYRGMNERRKQAREEKKHE